MTGPMWTVRRLCEEWQMHRNTVYRYIAAMRQTGRYSDAVAQAGGKMWIDPEAFRDFMTRRAQK